MTSQMHWHNILIVLLGLRSNMLHSLYKSGWNVGCCKEGSSLEMAAAGFAATLRPLELHK